MKLSAALITVFGLLSISAAVYAEDIPVYAEVSSVAELRSAVSNLKFMTGGAIYIKPGTYEISEPVLIKDSNHVSIFGAGSDKTIIRKIGDGNAIVFSGPDNSCTVRNIGLKGDPSAKFGSGIVFSDTDWSGLSTIDSCTIEDFPENGVYFFGRDLTPQSSHTLSNCLFLNNRKAQIYSNANNDFYFIRNHMIINKPAAAGAYGIYTRLSSAGNIAGNYFKNCRIGLKMDKSSSMNRIEYNFFDDCNVSAIDCGMVAPPDYDVTKIPRDQLYLSWEWSVPHKVRMTCEDNFSFNTVYSSGKNPDFIALNARSTLFSIFHGNRIITDGRIKRVLQVGDNCMTWIVTSNKVSGDVEQLYEYKKSQNILFSRNTQTADKNINRPKYVISPLSRRMLDVVKSIDNPSKQWFRKVGTADELISAVRDMPADGGTIYITAGTYRVQSPLIVENKSNVTIIGCGLSTFLRGVGDDNLLVFRGNCNNCYVGNLNMSPDKANPYNPVDQKNGSAILFQGSGDKFTVEYTILDNWPVSCVRIEGNPDKPVTRVKIVNSWIIRCRGEQVYLKGCRDFNVSENQYGYTFADKSPVGAYFEYCTDGIYEMNYHWGNKIGVQFAQGCEDIRIANNRSEQSKESGLAFGKPGMESPNRRFSISGNTFHSNSELDPGVWSDVVGMNTSDVKFTANQLHTWWQPRQFKYGVELDDNCGNWVFDSNYIRDYTEGPVKYNPKKSFKFKDNSYEAAIRKTE